MKLTKKLIEDLIIDYATKKTPISNINNTDIELFLKVCERDMGYFIYRHLQEKGIKLDATQVNFFLSNEVNDIAEIMKVLKL